MSKMENKVLLVIIRFNNKGGNIGTDASVTENKAASKKMLKKKKQHCTIILLVKEVNGDLLVRLVDHQRDILHNSDDIQNKNIFPCHVIAYRLFITSGVACILNAIIASRILH